MMEFRQKDAGGEDTATTLDVLHTQQDETARRQGAERGEGQRGRVRKQSRGCYQPLMYVWVQTLCSYSPI